jgi:hypothetical protein
VLANEMLATGLGHVLGLPVPRVEAIEDQELRIAPVSPQLALCYIAERVLELPKSY